MENVKCDVKKVIIIALKWSCSIICDLNKPSSSDFPHKTLLVHKIMHKILLCRPKVSAMVVEILISGKSKFLFSDKVEFAFNLLPGGQPSVYFLLAEVLPKVF